MIKYYEMFQRDLLSVVSCFIFSGFFIRLIPVALDRGK